MARKRGGQGKIPNTFRAPLVGDVHRDASYQVTPEVTPEVDIDTLPLRRAIQLALKLGHDPRVVCGIDTCAEHDGWKPVTERFAQTSTKAGKYAYGIDILWCRYCLQWVRDTEPQNMSLDTVIE